MVNRTKRSFSVLASLFALIVGIVVLAVNALVILDKFLNKDFYATLKVGFIGDAVNGISGNLVKFVTAGLAIVGLLLIILAIINFVSPVKGDGRIKFKGFALFLMTLFALVVAGCGATPFVVGAVKTAVTGTALYVCYGLLGLGALAFIFGLIALFAKSVKNTDSAKNGEADSDLPAYAPIVLVVEEKIKKLNQLRELGVLTEAQYNTAVARLINSI